jgi:ribokinase
LAAELVAFGDISIDVAVRIPHLPRPDEKLWVEIIGEQQGGMGANAAAAFAALGGRAALVTALGNDARGQAAIDDLEQRGVDVSGLVHLDEPSFWTLALLGDGGEKSLLQFATPALHVPWDAVDWSILDGAAYAHTVADEGDGNLRLIRESRSRGVTVSMDFEPTELGQDLQRELLAGCDVVFATPPAVASMGGPADADAAVTWLLSQGPMIATLTLGRDGCLVATADGNLRRIPGLQVEAVDTTGAGDCFAGAFLWGLARGRSAGEAALVANSMAGVSTTAIGSRGRLLSLAELAARPELAELNVKDWTP